METFALIGGITAAAGMVTVASLGYDPQGRLAGMLRRGVWGLAVLIAWNALPGLPDTGINPVSVWCAGSLGVAGAVGLSLLR